MIEAITSPVAMLLYGLASHVLKDMVRISGEGKPIGPLNYWKRFPYQTSLAGIGALVGFAGLEEMGQLTGLTAFGVGYMANSVSDIVGKRATDKL